MRRLPTLFLALFPAALVVASCGLPEVASSERTTVPDGAPVTDTDVGTDPDIEPPPLAEVDTEPVWASSAMSLQVIAEVPNAIAFSPRSGTLNYYIAARDGVIRVVERTLSETGTNERMSLATRPMLDLTDQVSLNGEQGLLDLTFSTDGRQLFVFYTDLGGDAIVARYDVDRSDRADVDTRTELLRVPQPAANHNGGGLAFGPDGYLYIGFGDGGGSGDPTNTGQNPDDLLGSLIRIDPAPVGGAPYSVPVNNPYVDGGGAPEVWLIGLRNPWRFSFDQLTGDLWIGDVGQNEFEEIDLLSNASGRGPGANLGWNQMEGVTPYEGGTEPAGHVRPVFVYDHSEGRCSVTGGYVSRAAVPPPVRRGVRVRRLLLRRDLRSRARRGRGARPATDRPSGAQRTGLVRPGRFGSAVRGRERRSGLAHRSGTGRACRGLTSPKGQTTGGNRTSAEHRWRDRTSVR